MKNRFGCRLALMLALSTAASVGLKLPSVVAAPAKPNFAPAGAGFSVWLPAKPQSSISKMPVPGRPAMNVKMYTLSSGPLSYVILPINLPAKLTPIGVTKFLDKTEKGFLKSTGAQLTSAKNTTLNGYKGRVVTGELGDNVFKAYFYAGNKRAFQLIAGSPKYKTVVQSAQIDKVLGSFRLAK